MSLGVEPNKALWPAGPWHDEPDRIDWVDPVTGVPCMMRRNDFGAWCGYVALPPTHPWAKLSRDEMAPYPHCHGGLSFNDHWEDWNPENGDRYRDVDIGTTLPWIGFDCHHGLDLGPALLSDHSDENRVYRDVQYVTAEVVYLAQHVINVLVESKG